MNILRLLKQGSVTYLAGAILAGVLSGLLLTYLIRMIHQAVLLESPNPVTFIGYYMLVWMAFVICTTLATFTTSGMAHKALYNLREWVTDHILKVSYRETEGRGSEFFPVLTEDIQTISYTIYRIPAITTASATILGCVAYMFYLSWPITLFIIGLFLLIYLVMSTLGKRAQHYAREARGEYDRMYHFFEDLVYGLKELKLNPVLRKHYRDAIFPPLIRKHQQLKLKENILFNFSIRTVEILFFPALGALVYSIFVYGLTTPAAFSGVLTVLLFMLSPLSTVANFSTDYKAMQVALQRVRNLESEIESSLESNAVQRPLPAPNEGSPLIECRNVTVSYKREDGRTNFTLGPIDLIIPTGKITFITGDNGSGKSTLAKVLTGLYFPESGQILYCGHVLESHYLESYRSRFASVFSDFHLFREMPPESVNREQLLGWINRFGLHGHVEITNDSVVLTALSQGQKERLAFAIACSYDSEILVLDEIASNQDAQFKERIYSEILPELRDNGKTIVVISHDQKYFSSADNILRFQGGKLEQLAEGL